MLLTVLTVASLLVAVALAAYAWNLRRDERLRSAARVTALAEAIEGSTGHGPAMFDRDPRSAVQGRPLLKVAVGFAMAVGIIVLIAMTGDRREAPSATPAPAAQNPGESLELLSMRHQRAGNALTVTGRTIAENLKSVKWNDKQDVVRPADKPLTPTGAVVDPINEYTHEDGCSITGGYVYRGSALEALAGTYFYSDFCGGWVRSVHVVNGQVTQETLWPSLDTGASVFFDHRTVGAARLLNG